MSLETPPSLSQGQQAKINLALKLHTHLVQIRQSAVSCLKVFLADREELLGLADQIKNLERAQIELYVAKANKIAPVEIGEETYISIWDSFAGKTVTQLMVDRGISKKKARPLLQRFHPDKKSGNRDLFDLVIKAVEHSDIELIHILWAQYVGTPPPEEAVSRFWSNLDTSVAVKIEFTKGHPFFKLAQMYYSGRHEELETTLRMKFKERIQYLVATNLGATNSGDQDDEHEQSED